MTSADSFLCQPDQTTDDAFLGGALRLLQPKSGYRAGLDAVLLAAAAQTLCNKRQVGARSSATDPAAKNANVLDIGAGVGTVGLCLASQSKATSIVLFERDPNLAQLATENINRNNLCEHVRAVVGEVGCSNRNLTELGLAPNSQDIVLANPPYHPQGHGTAPQSPTKLAAHTLDATGLEAWCRFMARMAKPGGWLVMINKIEALNDVLACLKNRAGEITILPIYPRKNAPAHRVLIVGKNGCRSNLIMRPGLVLHTDGNAYTPAAEAILRHGAALQLGCNA